MRKSSLPPPALSHSPRMMSSSKAASSPPRSGETLITQSSSPSAAASKSATSSLSPSRRSRQSAVMTVAAAASISQTPHRVLLYATCYNVLDGVTLTIRKLEQEILAAGHYVCILTTVSGDPANTHLDGEHPHRQVIFLDNAKPIPFVHDPTKPELSYQIGFALSASVQAAVDAFCPSIIHITCPDCTALHLIQYARTKEVPIMGTYHSNIPEYMDHYPGLSWLKHILGAFFRHQYNFLQALYVPTPYIQKHLTDTYKMDRATKLDIWGRGVDVDKFNPTHRSLDFRRQWGIDEKSIVICWVGRLVPEKRPDIFAHVIRRLNLLCSNCHALVIGAGACEDELKSLPKTTFTGWMNAEQLKVAYASSDIFLFPSSVETFGNVTLEAAASGLPVVVEEGCSGHLVYQNGFACPADDEDAFFEATWRLVTDHILRQSFGEASRRFALTLEKRSVVRKMLDNYTEVTEQFYTEYAGHHANRDSLYRKPDSFVAGNHPRPLLLVMVEYLFIVLFQVIWNMTTTFMYMHESFGSSRLAVPAMEPAKAPPVVNSMQRDMTPPRRGKTESSSTPPRFHVDHIPQGPPIIELEDVELGAESSSSQSCSAADPLLDDGSMTETSEAVSIDTSSAMSASLFSCAPSSQQAFGDCMLSHVLAKNFVRAMQIQCRVESQARNSMAKALCFRRSGSGARTFGLKRKSSSNDLQAGVAAGCLNSDLDVSKHSQGAADRACRLSMNVDDNQDRPLLLLPTQPAMRSRAVLQQG